MVMAKGYRPVRRDQLFLLPPDMRSWLARDHPVWLVIRVVERHLDTSVLHARRRAGGPGAAGYDPDMLLTLLVWAYAHQVTSSRRIEELCGTDVAFRVICGGGAPDHATVARFRQDFTAVIEDLFREVLVLCARLGMGQLGVVALDGTKIAANAARDANRSEETLRKLAARTVARHAAADAAEDGLFGAGQRGDRVPPEAADPGSRDERIRRALAGLQAEREAAEAAERALQRKYIEAAVAGTPKTGRPPAGAEVELARRRVERAEAAQQAKIADWERRRGAGRHLPGTPPLRPDHSARVRRARAALARAGARAEARAGPASARPPVRNITDPDSRLMQAASGGSIQAYNAQNVTSRDGLIIATELTSDPADVAWFEPMLHAAEDAAALITSHQPRPAGPDAGPVIGLILADAGYLSDHNLTIDGPDRLIATGKRRDLEKAARANTAASTASDEPASPAAAMTARLATEDGIAAYRMRGHIAETPHGQIKHTMGFRQLSLRGKPRASAEWKFACTVHNLIKAITTGHLTATTLNHLASQPA